MNFAFQAAAQRGGRDSMNPWITITLAAAGAVYGLDFLLRRKKWAAHTKAEKISLLVNMFSVGPYIFLSVLGLLWGIVASSPETAFGTVLYKATLAMGSVYFAVAIAAVVLCFVFRKKGKAKASIAVNIIALLYIAAAFAVNCLSGALL